MKTFFYSIIMLVCGIPTAKAQVPSAPVASPATSVGTSTFVANWATVSGATGYVIDIATDNSFTTFVSGYNNLATSSLANSGTTSGLVYSGLSSGTTYYYRIRAVNASGSSSNSGTITVTTLPGKPLALGAIDISNISFKAQWDAVTGATSYRLDVATNQTFTAFVTGYNNLSVASTSQVVTGLTPGTTYYYRIRATHATGTSENSNVINLKAVMQVPIANPPVSIQSASFYASWTLVPDATNYKIDISTSNAFSSFVSYYHNFLVSDLTSATTTSGLAYSGINSGTTYYYRVNAFNSSGSSGYSNTIAVTTFPLIPTAGNATGATHTSFVANWSAANGASTYRLDVSTNNSFSSYVTNFENITVTGTFAEVTGLAANSTYYYRVRAVNDAATSANSTVITAKTVVPPPTAGAATNISGSGFYVNWSTVSGASNYYVDISTSSAFSSFVSYYQNFLTSNLTAPTSTTGMANSSINNGTTYYYRLRAANTSGSSINSNIVTVLTLPSIPTITTATNKTNTSFTANWNAVTGAGEYRVDVSTNSSFTNILSGYNNVSTSTNSLNISGLTSNTPYYYRVRAVNTTGTTGNSTATSTSTLPLPAPQANPATSITTSSFYVNITAVPGASYYLLDISTSPDFTSYVGTYQGTSFSAGGTVSSYFTPGTTYYYRLRATGSAGQSAYSNVISVTTLLAAPVPTAATDITSISFNANWNAATGATGYRLDVSLNSSFSSYVSGYQNKAVSASPQPVTGLTPNTLYYYRVRAENISGTSSSSSNSSATTLLVGTPQAVSATSLQATSFIANWNAVAGVTEYRLDVSTAYSFSTFVSSYQNKVITGTSDLVSGLAPNTVYYYRVRAKNGVATSGNSNIVTVGKIVISEPALGQYVGINSPIIVRFTSPIYIANGIVKVYSGSTLVATHTNLYVFPGYDITLPTTGYTSGEAYRVKIEDGYNASVYGWSEEFTLNEARNFVKSTTLLNPGVTDNTGIVNAGPTDRHIQYTFFDGLGRQEQRVDQQGSPGGYDIVIPFSYDKLGRQSNNYLPYVSIDDDGWFKHNALKDPETTATTEQDKYQSGKQYQFYQTGGLVPEDEVPYSKTIFEPSALGRPIKLYGPGEDWATTGNDKFTEYKYAANVHGTGSGAQEKIIAWTLDDAGMPVRAVALTDYVEAGGYFASKQLFVQVTIDEQQHQVREYTDKEGRVILKKVQVTASPASLQGTSDWALTYYIYDRKGHLRYVFPPELSKLLHTNSDTYIVTSTDLNNWAFTYTYDYRNRMATKQVPGAGVVYMVYDKRDRLVLTQDANQRAGATDAIKYWMFTKYDELNRPILTGIKDTTTNIQLTQAQMQAVVNAHYAKAWAKYGETYIGNAAGNVHGYSNKSYPVLTTAGTLDLNRYLTATYYDNYDFRNLWTGPYTYVDENQDAISNGITYSQPDAEFNRVKNQVTGSKIKVLDGGVTGGVSWLKSITYYDDNYRTIQSISDNYKGGTDRTTSVYDFTGKILKTKGTHSESDLAWRDVTSGIIKSGERLYRGAGGSDFTQGAASVAMLPANQDGWFEFTYSNANQMYIGLSDANTDNNATSIDYGLRVGGTSDYSAYMGTGSLTTVAANNIGDVFRLERTSGTLRVKRNGVVEYTFSTTSVQALLVDISFYSGQSSVLFARSSFSGSNHTIIRRFEYDHAGRLLNTWHKLDSQSEILLTKNTYNELGQLIDKKLHSTVASAADAKQSVDYRYNIRGWLTSMNNAALSNDGTTNDDAGDLFGMNLAYNTTDLGVGNSSMFNGNISGITWSNNLGLGATKQNGYIYTYDPMNRIISSTFKEKTASWTALTNSANAETDFIYDLNGNIKNLQRNDKRTAGLMMDILEYDYGPEGSKSNKLLKVTDAGDDFTGFIDGHSGATNDYTYDANGNMTTDLNKGVSTAITYNFLNLPDVVTKGANSINYVYDAGGRKLAQVTSFGGAFKQTDYAGEYQYENDVLQYIAHEEGRIVMAETKTVCTHSADVVTGITAFNATLAAVTQNGTEKYVRATSNGTVTRTGMYPIGNTLSVTAGETYRIRAKGYRTGSNAVYLLIKVNGIDMNWPGATLANGATAESWTEQTVTITANGTLDAGVVWNTVTNGEQFFLNAFEIVKVGANTIPEYQYNLKDHLGNNRLTFTTKEETLIETATLETASAGTEQGQFLRFAEARKIQSFLFDKTNGSSPNTTTGYAQRLNGSANERYGLGKSISVMPGDVVNAEVYAKYIDPVNTNWTAALSTLLSQVAAGTAPAGTVIDGGNYSGSTGSFPFVGAAAQNTANSSETGPKAYLNWLVFDRDFNFILSESGYDRISTGPKENGQDVAHERLYSPAITIKQPGYVYIYLSNEESTPLEVYFDDFKVTHTKSPVIQTDDYYAFGLNFNSYQRENNNTNQYLYNGKEKQDELDLNWLDYGARMYMSEIGRWGVIDFMADKLRPVSPYSYALNNPIKFIDVNGDIPWTAVFGEKVKAWISSAFGWRTHPITKKRSFHNGLDLPASLGTEARVLASGKVIKTGTNHKMNGNWIEIDHGQGYITKYLHLQDKGFLVKEGDRVTNGQSIGLVGSTGSSTGPHLHLIMSKDGKEIDPNSIKDLEDLVGEYSELISSAEQQVETLEVLADGYADMAKYNGEMGSQGDANYYKAKSDEYKQGLKEARVNLMFTRLYIKLMQQLEFERNNKQAGSNDKE